MSEEYIELHAVQGEDGLYRVFDQHGRKVRGLSSVSVMAAHDAITTITMTVLDIKDGRPWVNRAPRSADTTNSESDGREIIDIVVEDLTKVAD